jgi:hypothetical protein
MEVNEYRLNKFIKQFEANVLCEQCPCYPKNHECVWNCYTALQTNKKNCRARIKKYILGEE